MRDKSQETVQGHNVDNKIPVHVSISNPHMHMQLPPPLLQRLPLMATCQYASASKWSNISSSVNDWAVESSEANAYCSGTSCIHPKSSGTSSIHRGRITITTFWWRFWSLDGQLNRSYSTQSTSEENSTADVQIVIWRWEVSLWQSCLALRKRFKPIDIEEVWGIEFNQKIQQDESIHQLGIGLQNLGRKAFPQMNEKELGCLLKGRFFKALNSKRQRKLAAPKLTETVLWPSKNSWETWKSNICYSFLSRVMPKEALIIQSSHMMLVDHLPSRVRNL